MVHHPVPVFRHRNVFLQEEMPTPGTGTYRVARCSTPGPTTPPRYHTFGNDTNIARPRPCLRHIAYILEGTATECNWSALALKKSSSGLSTGGAASTID